MAAVSFSGDANIGADGVDASTILGGQLTLNGGVSTDPEGGPLTYQWTIATKPVGSNLTLSGTTAATQTITPDVAGTFELNLLVTDNQGLMSSKKSTMLVKTSAPLPAGFVPLATRYSKFYNKLVTISGSPAALTIVDPQSGAVQSVTLPALVNYALELSPDGKLAMVLQAGSVSLYDLATGTLIHSTAVSDLHTAAFVTNNGYCYVIGGRTIQPLLPPVTVVDGRTGTNLTATLGMDDPSIVTGERGIYSAVKKRMYHFDAVGTNQLVKYFDVSPTTGKVSAPGQTNYGPTGQISPAFFLVQGDEVLLGRNRDFLLTGTTPSYAGTWSASGATALQSASESPSTGETIMLTISGGLLRPLYSRFTNVTMTYVQDVALPQVNGLPAYGVGVFHSAAGKQVFVLQTGTAIPNNAGASYHVVIR